MIKPTVKPQIIYTVDPDQLAKDPLYGMKEWDKQISKCLLSLIFDKKFNQLWSNTYFLSSGILLEVNSDIPIGAGLGSSAAWSTSLSAAIYYYYQYTVVEQRQNKISEMSVQSVAEIWKLAYDLEGIDYGTPSRIDSTTADDHIKFKNRTKFKIIGILYI